MRILTALLAVTLAAPFVPAVPAGAPALALPSSLIAPAGAPALTLPSSLIAPAVPAGVAALAVPSAPAAPAPAVLTWSVTPAGAAGPDGRAALEYKLDPGARLTDRVAVTNHSRRKLTLRLYASDAYTTPGGGYDLLPGNRKPGDAGAWVKVGRETVVLPPSSRVVVPVTVAVPDNATPGDHAGGVVASLVSGEAAADADQVSVDHRVGTRVYLRVTGPLRPELTVRDVRVTRHVPWNPLRLPTVTTEFTVVNTGNLRLTGAPSVRTHGIRGWGSREADAPALPQLLPGGEIRTGVTARGVWPLGRSWIAASVQPEAVAGQVLHPLPPRAGAGSAIWLVPWPQLAVLGLLGLVVLLVRWARRRRAAALSAAIAAAERRGRESTTLLKEGQ